MGDAGAAPWRTRPLDFLGGTGPVLVFALSGMGKSTLAAAHPDVVLDADHFLYGAVELGFPELEPRARLVAWRKLCRTRPWQEGGEDLERWARVRRAFREPMMEALRAGPYRLVLTSLLDPPWAVSAFYGVEQGRYLEHMRLAGRETDNRQSEAMNDRLEGYSPLRRLPAGSFLGDQPEIVALLEGGLASVRRCIAEE